MALLIPIIHCRIDAEPTSFHDKGKEGNTVTFAVNLSVEAPARQEETEESEKRKEIDSDEKAAEKTFERILAEIETVEFHVYRLEDHPGGNATLAAVDELIPEKVSAPNITSSDGHVFRWLKMQEQSEQIRYWTSPEEKFNPELTVEATIAGAAPRLRAAQAWNAPAAHVQGLTHLLRLKLQKDDEIYVVLPYLYNPDPQLPIDVKVLGTAGNWNEAIVECTYDPNQHDKWRCWVNPIGKKITVPPPSAPVDDLVSKEGFLFVNEHADEIRRFLKTFEERAASIMTSANALHVDGKEDAKELEKIFGINQVKEGAPYQWGRAIWYVVSRLVAALDNHVLALLKPVAYGKSWMPNPHSEGDVLSPLVWAILREIDESKVPGNFDGKKISAAIRSVLRQHCPFVDGGPRKSLVPALRHVYGIAELQDQTPPSDPATLVSCMLKQYRLEQKKKVLDPQDYNQVPQNAEKVVKSLANKSVELLSTTLTDLEQPLYDEAGSERALIRVFETVEFDTATAIEDGPPTAEERLTYRIANAIAQATPDDLLHTAVASGWAKYKAVLEGPFNAAEAIRRAVSASFTDALLKAANVDKGKLPPQLLRDSIYVEKAEKDDSDTKPVYFYERRLTGKTGASCFEVMAMPLVRPDNGIRTRLFLTNGWTLLINAPHRRW